ncbi:MAG TPA: DUF2971 domain-containing protein [Bryobacteraceae bacterium]|nr:DUF2971 domain-containing protein [Bryobacteraceae bacterium]
MKAEVEALKARLHAPIFALLCEWDEHEPPGLYHYTTTLNFRKILSSKVLWSTDVLKMNDSTEFLYAQKLVHLILQGKWQRLPVSVSDSFNPRRGPVGLGDVWRIYAACFCTRNDQLGQWWRYADAAMGVALQFDYGALSEYSERTKRFAIIPMRYGAIQLIDAVEFIAELGLALSDESDLSFEAAEQFWPEVCLRILNTAIHFKHPVYAEEREWRVLSICETSEPCSTRISSGELTHFLELPIIETSLRRVIVGPRASNATQRELTHLLIGCGLDHVEVVPAAIPIRNY